MKVEWEYGLDGQLIAFAFIREQLAAALADVMKPGWSALAAKEGPLAMMMGTIPQTQRR